MAELSQHPDVVDLAEYAEGLLDDPRRAAVEQHVRGCPDCSQTLTDLAALPAALAAAPLPPLPADVADRLDRAIAAESQARASGWSGTAQVTPLRPKRRWLAPVVAAAAVIGAVAIAVPVLDSQNGEDDAGSAQSADEEYSASGGSSERSAEENGIPPDNAVPNAAAPVIALTSDSFGRDVVDAYYSGNRELRVSSRPVATASQPTDLSYYSDELARISGPCGLDSDAGAVVDDITYDGESARLLRQEAGKAVDVIAFTCDAGEPTILDGVTLRPRS